MLRKRPELAEDAAQLRRFFSEAAAWERAAPSVLTRRTPRGSPLVASGLLGAARATSAAARWRTPVNFTSSAGQVFGPMIAGALLQPMVATVDEWTGNALTQSSDWVSESVSAPLEPATSWWTTNVVIPDEASAEQLRNDERGAMFRRRGENRDRRRAGLPQRRRSFWERMSSGTIRIGSTRMTKTADARSLTVAIPRAATRCSRSQS